MLQLWPLKKYSLRVESFVMRLEKGEVSEPFKTRPVNFSEVTIFQNIHKIYSTFAPTRLNTTIYSKFRVSQYSRCPQGFPRPQVEKSCTSLSRTQLKARHPIKRFALAARTTSISILNFGEHFVFLLTMPCVALQRVSGPFLST